MLSLIVFVTVTAGVPAQAPSAGIPSVKDVAWIAGCWDSTRNGRHVAEHWMPPEGGTMMGVSRTTAGEKTTEWEFLIIRQGARGLEYVAKPSGQPEGTFTATRATQNEVVFENPAHDFPKRIAYKRDGDSLTAWIEGPMGGQNRRIEFPYKKSACGG
jgi:hypothetical protein